MDRDRIANQDAGTAELRDYVEEDDERVQADVEAAKAILQLLIQALVDLPQVVQIGLVSGSQSVIFEVSVDREDVRRIIGRKGRTADALREIMFNLGAKAGRRYLLEIVEPERRMEEIPALAAEARLGTSEVVGRPRIRLDLAKDK